MKGASFRQIQFTFLIGIACFSAFLLPSTVSVTAAKTAVLVPLIGTGITCLYCILLLKLLIEYGSVGAFLEQRFGTKAHKIGRIFLSFWLSGICVFYVCALYDRLAATAFSFLPKWLALSLIVLTAALLLFADGKAVGRSVQIVFLLMLLSMAVLVAFSAGSVTMKELLPVKGNTVTGFFVALLFPVGMCGFLSFLFFDFEGKLQHEKALYGTVCAAGIWMSAVIFLTQSVFGVHLSESLSYPFFALIRSTDSFFNTEHFESLLSGAWIIMSLCFFAVLLRLAVMHFRRGFSVHGRKGALLGAIRVAWILIAALLLPDNRFLIAFVLGVLLPVGNLVLGILLPSALYIFAGKNRFFSHGRRKKGCANESLYVLK